MKFNTAAFDFCFTCSSNVRLGSTEILDQFALLYRTTAKVQMRCVCMFQHLPGPKCYEFDFVPV